MAGFQLPLSNTAVREQMGDIAHVAEVLDYRNVAKLPVVWQARRKALEAMAADSAIKRINFIVIRADSDERWLISIGRRGGWRKLWNFGTGRD
jgi:hypothetical protein